MSRVIQNFELLAQDELRGDALGIAEAGYAAINTDRAIGRKITLSGDTLAIDGRAFPLSGRRVYFVGIGKCAFAAAGAIERLLGDTLSEGIALDVGATENLGLQKIRPYRGTHPLPSDANAEAARAIVEFLEKRTEEDLVLMLVSGGGSALLCLHDSPMTCSDESILFKELTARGAAIRDINTVRKHISLARGGALAKAAYPAEVIALMISDVPGDDIATIASGPTVRDATTVADAATVLERYGISRAISFSETPKDERYFDRVTNLLFLTSKDALEAMREEAVRRGYAAEVADARYTGEAREIGISIAERMTQAPAKTALLYAGESTVTLGTGGRGGRNQELALAALSAQGADTLILPFASDGHDNSDHAGAIADELTRAHAASVGADPEAHLREHRSFDFFKMTGDALMTGYTGSNVSDLIIALKK